MVRWRGAQVGGSTNIQQPLMTAVQHLSIAKGVPYIFLITDGAVKCVPRPLWHEFTPCDHEFTPCGHKSTHLTALSSVSPARERTNSHTHATPPSL